MLRAMRTGAKSAVLKLFIFGMVMFAMLGLVLMDVNGVFSKGTGGDGTIFSMKGQKVTAAEFDRSVRSALQQTGMRSQEAYAQGLPRQVLQQEISTRIMAQFIYDAGILVDDKLASARIKDILQPLVDKGMQREDALERLLRVQGMDQSMLVATIKNQIAAENVLKAITTGVYAPKAMVDDTYRYRNEERTGKYFTITASDIAPVKNPSDDELQAYYKTVVTGYMTPEYRSLDYILVSQDHFAKEIKISDEDVRAAYDDNIGDYTTPAAMIVEQAVLQSEDAALAVLALAKSGKGLEKAVDAKGGTDGVYLSAEAFDPKTVVEELAGALKDVKEKSYTGVIKSPLGWHVLYLKDLTSAKVRSFDQVKAELKAGMLRDQAANKLYELTNKVDDDLAGGAALSDVAAGLGIKVGSTGQISANGKTRDGKKTGLPQDVEDKLLTAAFQLDDGATSQLIETSDGGFFAVGVTGVTLAAEKPLKDIKADVLAQYMDTQVQKAIHALAADVTMRIKKGQSFDDAARALGKTASTSPVVRRGAKAAGGLDPAFVPALFSLEKTGSVSNTGTQAGEIIVQVASVIPAKAVKSGDKNVVQMRTQIERGLQDDILEQFNAALMKKYDVVVNDAVFDKAYAPTFGDEPQ